MTLKRGYEMYLYYSAAGIGGTPAWTLLAIVRGVKVPWSRSEIPVTTRGAAGWKQVIYGLLEAGVDFDMPYDADDAGLAALRAAFIANTPIGIAAMNGPVNVAGSEGLWADCAVGKFDTDEPLDGDATVAVSLKPTYSANVPQFKVIGA